MTPLWEITALGSHSYLPAGSGDFPGAGTQFSDPGRMQGWVNLGGGYIPR